MKIYHKQLKEKINRRNNKILNHNLQVLFFSSKYLYVYISHKENQFKSRIRNLSCQVRCLKFSFFFPFNLKNYGCSDGIKYGYEAASATKLHLRQTKLSNPQSPKNTWYLKDTKWNQLTSKTNLKIYKFTRKFLHC